MLEKVLAMLSGVDMNDPEGLLLLNLAVQIQEHSGIDWALEGTMSQIVNEFQAHLDDLEC